VKEYGVKNRLQENSKSKAIVSGGTMVKIGLSYSGLVVKGNSTRKKGFNGGRIASEHVLRILRKESRMP